MEKRVVFNGRWLQALLLLPQLIITLIFFFMPAGEALYQSLFRQDAFGLSLDFVGLENFSQLFADEKYLNKELAKRDRQYLKHHILHAQRIVFKTFAGEEIIAEAPLPEDCEVLLKGLSLD